MNNSYEIAIVGLGAMGSAALHQLALRGHAVIGFDRFNPPHTNGSSHGQTRIIREAIFENPLYVPLVRHAFDLWRELELQSGRNLLNTTGGLLIGNPKGELVGGGLRALREYGVGHKILTMEDLSEHFPMFSPEPGMVGLHEERAGFLIPEDCIQANLDLARKHSATIRTEEAVLKWERDAQGFRLFTDQGDYRAERLIVSGGAWLPKLVPTFKQIAVPMREVLHWFEPSDPTARFGADEFPVFIFEYNESKPLLYGFPNTGKGVKVALHHGGTRDDPDTVSRDVRENEQQAMRELMAQRMPAAAGTLRDSVVCLYTNLPDQDFLIDFLPSDDKLLVVSPCSGHGFKFASTIGEITADLITGKTPPFDLGPFKFRW